VNNKTSFADACKPFPVAPECWPAYQYFFDDISSLLQLHGLQLHVLVVLLYASDADDLQCRLMDVYEPYGEKANLAQ